mgnify:FL=1
MKHVQIKVDGMTCGGCVNSVQNALTSHEGVKSAKATLDTGLVDVDFDPAVIGQVEIENAIEGAGFDVVRS